MLLSSSSNLELAAAIFPQCCMYPAYVPACEAIFQAFSSGWCCNPLSIPTNKSANFISFIFVASGGRKKRSNAGCGMTCRSINYCTRKIGRSNWDKNYSECCCHPYRKYAYYKKNAECRKLGVPSV